MKTNCKRPALLQKAATPDDSAGDDLADDNFAERRDEKHTTQSGLKLLERLKLVGDPAMPRGQFEIDSGEGVFFYDIGVQLTDIRRVLMENLNESEIERRATGQPGSRSATISRPPVGWLASKA